jgi:FkbM family methyltransferase
MGSIKRTIGFILQHPLGKKHPVRALGRFGWWQLQCRISSAPFIVKKFIGGTKFYASKGLTGITGNIYTGLHEFNDMGFLLHFLRRDDVFFDVGANVGSYTLLASGTCGARSVSMEPVPSTFNILSKNIALNQLQGKVKLINSAVGAAPGNINFSANEDTTNHVIAGNESANNAVSVPVITIDSLLTSQQPALIKIDVEGFETEVIKGMAATLKTNTLKAIIIELNGSGGRYGFNEKDIHNQLLENNFSPYNYNPFKRLLTPVVSYGTHNTIYCRDMGFINHRLQNADTVKIMGELI